MPARWQHAHDHGQHAARSGVVTYRTAAAAIDVVAVCFAALAIHTLCARLSVEAVRPPVVLPPPVRDDGIAWPVERGIVCFAPE